MDIPHTDPEQHHRRQPLRRGSPWLPPMRRIHVSCKERAAQPSGSLRSLLPTQGEGGRGWGRRKRERKGLSLTVLFPWPGNTASLETMSGSFLQQVPLHRLMLAGQSPGAGTALRPWTWRMRCGDILSEDSRAQSPGTGTETLGLAGSVAPVLSPPWLGAGER